MTAEQHNRDNGNGQHGGHFRLRVPFRFDKSAYLLVLMLISVNFFHFTPIASLTGNDICLALFLLWLVAAHFLYNPPEKFLGFTWKRYYWLLLLIGLGVLISFIPALILQGQSLAQSFISSRTMLALLALPAIGTVQPNRKELEKAVIAFSFILLAFACLDALGVPLIDREFYISETNPNRELIDEDSFVILLPGFQFIVVALFFFLDRIKGGGGIYNLSGALFFIGAVFLLQNRTILFIAALVFAYTLLSIQGSTRRQTVLYRSISVVLLGVMIASTIPHWIRLFTETAMQLGSSDYNRILAYNYFLFQACPSWVYYLTGTGFISANVSSIMQDLMEAGIYNSDVGFIGFWNYYGVLPVVAVIVAIIQGFSKKTRYYVKFNAFFLLISGLTIACFDTMDKILWLCLFLYMVYHKSHQSVIQ